MNRKYNLSTSDDVLKVAIISGSSGGLYTTMTMCGEKENDFRLFELAGTSL